MTKNTLSKTNYLIGARCPKALQFKLNHPEYSSKFRVEEDFSELNEAFELSKEYFPGCVTVNGEAGFEEALKETQALLDNGTETIANAMFKTPTNETCRVRLMHKNSEGAYDIFDVLLKGPAGEKAEKKFNIDGIAFIYQVLKRCGVDMGGLFIMHINPDFVKHGPIDPREYYRIYDCTTYVYAEQGIVVNNIEKCWEAIRSDSEVVRERNSSCLQPQDNECEFSCHCFADIPKNSILNVVRLLPSRALPLIDRGIVTIKDLADSGEKLTPLQRMQVDTEAYNLPPRVDVINLKDTLSAITYPLYHLDFETVSEPVPHFDGQKPWQQVPFQFSLHVQKCKGAEPEHYEFLAQTGTDYRRALAEALCKYIPMDVCSLAYHMSFEQKVLRDLAELYPDLSAHLLSIHDNMKDLEVPFSKRYYYCGEMKGRSSIKTVLPAMCPGDPELDYTSLEGVHRGDEASKAFKDMAKKTADEVAATRRQLLAYCRLDTLAMVKVLEALYVALDAELGKAA